MMFEFYFENYSRVSAYLLASVLDRVHVSAHCGPALCRWPVNMD